MKTTVRFIKMSFLSVLVCTGICVQAQKNGANYARIQYNNPIGEYKDFYSYGIGLEYGHTFYFDIALGELVSPGIDVTFLELAYDSGKEYDYSQGLSASETALYNYKTKGGFLMTAGPKVGLAAQMELIDGLFLETSIKYCPTLVFGSRTLARTSLNPKEQSSSCFAFSNRLSLNLGLKYQWFSFGGEFVFGKAKLDYSKDIIPDFESNPILQDEKNLGMNTFKLYVGFNF